jgi:UDP-xylose/UDP-N-acetylglucosamine transporter B4
MLTNDSFRDRVELGPPFGLPVVKKTSSPLWWYLLLTSIFWTLSILNNMAYDYEISQPLHMVFRSSSLAVSLLLGFLLFRKRYNLPQVVFLAKNTVCLFDLLF